MAGTRLDRSIRLNGKRPLPSLAGQTQACTFDLPFALKSPLDPLFTTVPPPPQKVMEGLLRPGGSSS